jgi:hypothetical protein
MFVTRQKLLALLFLCAVPIASGQQQSGTKSEKKGTGAAAPGELSQRPFESLMSERDSLTSQMSELSNDIWYLGDAISKREEMKRLKTANKPSDEIEKTIVQAMGYAHVAETNIEDLDKQLDLKNNNLAEKQKRKTAIDDELNQRANIVGPQQKFKLNMSLIFALLVGLVILGFFAVAFRDEQVRREIFSGQAGIQFVTLFSLVIAIILFGIIDILEGKELAALLGGLSGYILGRSTSGASARPKPDGEGGGSARGQQQE